MLAARNPRLVLARMPSVGLSGPYRNYLGFGVNFEGLCGLTWLRGYPDLDLSENEHVFHMDAASGASGAFAVLAALRRREQTGRGELIELSQCENMLNHIGELLVDARLERHRARAAGQPAPHPGPPGRLSLRGRGPVGGDLGGRRPRVGGPVRPDRGARAGGPRRGRAPAAPRRAGPAAGRVDLAPDRSGRLRRLPGTGRGRRAGAARARGPGRPPLPGPGDVPAQRLRGDSAPTTTPPTPGTGTARRCAGDRSR